MPAAAAALSKAAPAADPQSGWLTMREAALYLRFGSATAFTNYLRRGGLTVPVYRRAGNKRLLFMRVEDVDKVMQLVPVRPTPVEVTASEPAEPPRYERVESPAPRAVPRRRGRR